MRIAVWHNLLSGGGKRTLYNHIKVLKEKGNYLEAWTTDMSSSDYLPLSDLIIENRKELKIKFEPLGKIKNPITQQRKKIELLNKHCKECIKEIESKKFDLLFANSCFFSYMPYIGIFTELPKIAYIGEPYRYLYEAMPENFWQAPSFVLKIKKIRLLINDFKTNYARRIMVLKEIEAAKSYRKILVNSLFSRESVIRSYGIDADLCYLGIDTDNFKLDITQKEPFVIGLGKISYSKSVHRAIEIIGAIPEESRPVLKWVSNGFDNNYFNEMVSLAEKLKVGFQVFINISDNDLKNLAAKAAIMIYTSRLEPFGLAPLEANSCGTYVVAIAEGGIRESITNGVNGTLINGYKINEFTDVIKLFTKDLEFAKRKGIEARNFVKENWGYQFMADNILSEIEEIKKEYKLV